MPKTADASSFTQFQKINAQSIKTTGKPTVSSAISATTTVASIVKATAVAASVAPKSAITATSNLKGNTKKRG